jgi:DNA-directed RNA polymerase specialized sigma24 family protein
MISAFYRPGRLGELLAAVKETRMSQPPNPGGGSTPGSGNKGTIEDARRSLVSLAYYKTKDPHMAEDIANDAILQFHGERGCWPASINQADLARLRELVRNACAKWYRRINKEKPLNFDIIDPLGLHRHLMDGDRVAAAIGHLEPADRELLHGVVTGVPLEILAKKFGCSVDTLKVRIVRLRIRINRLYSSLLE